MGVQECWALLGDGERSRALCSAAALQQAVCAPASTYVLLRNAASRWVWKSLPLWIACLTFYTKCTVSKLRQGRSLFFLFFVKLLSGCRSPWLILHFFYYPYYFHMQSFLSVFCKMAAVRDACSMMCEAVLLQAVFPWAVQCIPPGACSGNTVPRTPWVSLICHAKKEEKWIKNRDMEQKVNKQTILKCTARLSGWLLCKMWQLKPVLPLAFR